MRGFVKKNRPRGSVKFPFMRVQLFLINELPIIELLYIVK